MSHCLAVPLCHFTSLNVRMCGLGVSAPASKRFLNYLRTTWQPRVRNSLEELRWCGGVWETRIFRHCNVCRETSPHCSCKTNNLPMLCSNHDSQCYCLRSCLRHCLFSYLLKLFLFSTRIVAKDVVFSLWRSRQQEHHMLTLETLQVYGRLRQ